MQDTMYGLGISLVKRKVVEFETLEKALKIKQQEGITGQRSIAQILVSEFELDYDRVYREVADIYGFKRLELSVDPPDDKVIEFIQKMVESLPQNIRSLMEREKILIYKQTDGPQPKVILVTVDPTNKYIASVARALGANRFEVCYISPNDYEQLVNRVFPPENEFLKIIEDSGIEIHEEDQQEADSEEDALDAEINNSLVINLVEGTLVEAVRRGASDIHIIPKDAKTTEIHFRIDGKLRLWHVQKGIRPEAITAVVKDRTKNVDRFEREKAQDGFIQRKIEGHMIRYRVSVLPIVGQEFSRKLESIVVRILDDRNVITDFEKLGFLPAAKKAFLRAISKPQGMVILTGPTGSGKSTTLLAALSYLIKPELNVLTVEDPVEYIIPGARQLKIGPKNDFEQALRAILRHDPDVVMVGEIRDKLTAETAIKLANTGHLTFSTLHTNDAPSAISRLYKMGVEPFLIAYAINIVIAQRLVRRLCEKCKKPVENLDPAVPLDLGFTAEEAQQSRFFAAVGCEECHGGYKGRAAIHEALYFSPEIRNLIFRSGKDIDEESVRNLAMKQGMLNLRAAGRELAKRGMTTLEEIAQATSED